MRVSAIASCRGVHNNVTVWFEDLPCLECENKAHRKREPKRDFSQWLIEEIYINDQIPWAVLDGRRSMKCLRCKEPLDPAGYTNGEIAGDINIDGFARFRARIRATTIQCAACGVGQLVPDVTDVNEVNAAIRDALTNAGLDFA